MKNNTLYAVRSCRETRLEMTLEAKRKQFIARIPYLEEQDPTASVITITDCFRNSELEDIQMKNVFHSLFVEFSDLMKPEDICLMLERHSLFGYAYSQAYKESDLGTLPHASAVFKKFRDLLKEAQDSGFIIEPYVVETYLKVK